MKSVVISIFIAISIVIGSVAYGNHMQKVSDTLVSLNDGLISEIYKENYSAAEDILDNIMEYINSQRTVLSVTDDHEVLNKIEININELYSYIKGEQKIDALSKCGGLKALFEHLPNNYELRLENIL